MAGALAGAGAIEVGAQDLAAGDPFAEGAVFLEADEIEDDRENLRYIARGAVEARYGARILRAEEVEYYPEEGRVVARGAVSVREADGSTLFVDEIELTDDLASAVAEGFAARLKQPGRGPDAKIGAAYVVKRGETRTELGKAFYTVCEACGPDGQSKRPTWRLTARKVVQDKNRGVIFYRDALLELKGVPIAYTPYFSHADPSLGRRSGFLVTGFGENSSTGVFVEQPYYWAISDHQDLTTSLRWMDNVDPLVGFEHRRSWFSGYTTFIGSITQEQDFDTDGVKFGDDKLRGHLFGDGRFNVAEDWEWGFGVETVTDDLYFERYGLSNEDRLRGPYRRGSKRLLNQLYLRGVDETFYASVAALEFQGLRAQDDDDALPLIAPIAEFRRMFAAPVVGGTVEARASTAFLTRNQGQDSSRVTAELDWSRRLITSGGLVIDPFALVRADHYDVSDFVPIGETEEIDDTITRGLGLVGVDVGFPMARPVGSADLVVEPLVQLVAATNSGADSNLIPNEDSLSLTLDEASLLSVNRVNGYDLWEEGARATVGASAAMRWGASGETRVFLGQSYRAEGQSDFSEATGLEGTTSDLVGSFALTLDSRNALSANFNLDDSDYDVKLADVGARGGMGPVDVSARYLMYSEPENNVSRETANYYVGLALPNNFYAYYSAARDLDEDKTRVAFTGLSYTDECSRIELLYKEDFTQDRSIGIDRSIRVQFTLSTLGSFRN